MVVSVIATEVDAKATDEHEESQNEEEGKQQKNKGIFSKTICGKRKNSGSG